MKKTSIILGLFLIVTIGYSQKLNWPDNNSDNYAKDGKLMPQSLVDQLSQYPEEWNSQWITHPDIDKTAYGLVHFRKVFDLESVPVRFIVHVSGDNRYRLYVNGVEVCYGPQLDDIRHWRYETIDLGPFLRKGKNTIAAEVINWGVERSYGIISFKTGFLLQGNFPSQDLNGRIRIRRRSFYVPLDLL